MSYVADFVDFWTRNEIETQHNIMARIAVEKRDTIEAIRCFSSLENAPTAQREKKKKDITIAYADNEGPPEHPIC